MPNPHGTPIWYELLTHDPEKVKPFYQAVMGWTIAERADPAAGGMDYRMIERPDGGYGGGALVLDDGMKAEGARPGWLIYFGVEDVDRSVAEAQELGASVHMPAMTLDGVGRMAMLADPQGAPFYVMRGASDEASDAHSFQEPGGCRWNELTSSDAPAAVSFYGKLLRFGTDNFMPMDDAGKYVFLEVAGEAIGAIGPARPEEPTGWLPYFGVRDVDTAKQAAQSGGGRVLMGPIAVPGDDWIIVAEDPGGAQVGFVGPKG